MRPTFKQACAQYVHRYTMDHTPEWALLIAPNGKHYAPGHASDQEWYDSALFPGEPGGPDAGDDFCFSSGHTFPMGDWLP